MLTRGHVASHISSSGWGSHDFSQAWLKIINPALGKGPPGKAPAMAKQERYQLLEAAIYNLENMDNGRSKSALLGQSIAPRSGQSFVYFVNADCQKRTVTVHQKVSWDIIKAHDVYVGPRV